MQIGVLIQNIWTLKQLFIITIVSVLLKTCTGIIFSLQDISRRQVLSSISNSVILASTPISTREKKTNPWSGTQLPLLEPSTAEQYLESSGNKAFLMGRWPDPILRKPSVPTPTSLFGTSTLKNIANGLRQTSRDNNAVGLAAQQTGIHISLIYLDFPSKRLEGGLYLVNPRIVSRSPEQKSLVWIENCLVFPPDFSATVLRDAAVTVEAYDLDGRLMKYNFRGEEARTFQHEFDHDCGILITDHITFDEMMSDDMREIEKNGHEERQTQAYGRIIEPSLKENTVLSRSFSNINDNKKQNAPFFCENANAIEPNERKDNQVSQTETQNKCDSECQKRIEERRQLNRQSRSTRSRQEIMDLSKQRAALYNTTYQGTNCVPGVPCL